MESSDSTTNYDFFLGKQIKVMMSLANGVQLTYRGKLERIDSDSIFIHDRLEGPLILARKDISQVREI